jgi:hypothetical protein
MFSREDREKKKKSVNEGKRQRKKGKRERDGDGGKTLCWEIPTINGHRKITPRKLPNR